MSDTERDPKLSAYALFLYAYSKLNNRLSAVMESPDTVPIDVYDVLVTLEYEPDHRLRLSDLADKIALSRSGLTRRIDRLEKLGYIRREGCPEDKRGSFAVLTDEGKAAREASWPRYRDAIQANFGDKMTEGEAKQLAALMRRIVDSLDRSSA